MRAVDRITFAHGSTEIWLARRKKENPVAVTTGGMVTNWKQNLRISHDKVLTEAANYLDFFDFVAGATRLELATSGVTDRLPTKLFQPLASKPSVFSIHIDPVRGTSCRFVPKKRGQNRDKISRVQWPGSNGPTTMSAWQ